MKPIILLSQQDLETYSPVCYSFQVDKLVPHILQAQNEMRDIITKDLYDALVSAIEQSRQDPPIPIPDRFLKLLNAMAQSLALRSIYYALPSLWLQINQKGITRESSENSSSASKSELVYLRDDLNSNWTKTVQIFTEWLSDNSADFPEYKSTKTSIPDAPQSLICFY